MFADRQLDLGSQEPCGQDGLGLQQCQEEAEGISQYVAHCPNYLASIAEQILKCNHARRIAVAYQNERLQRGELSLYIQHVPKQGGGASCQLESQVSNAGSPTLNEFLKARKS